MRRTLFAVAATAALAMAAGGAIAQSQPQSQSQSPGGPTAQAPMKDKQGKALGTIRLVQHPHGVVVRGELDGLPGGWHAIHVHATGKCEPDFNAAGGHFNPGNAKHGLDDTPMHAGDLPNFYADERGHARFEMLTQHVTLTDGATSLFDQDGASFIIHANPDDHASEPAGNSGDRIACGVVAKS